jgi:dienelactone hydrolase
MMSVMVAVALLASSVQAEIVTKAVPYKHGDVELEGFLAYDSAIGSGKRPAVLIVHEWWGLNDYARQRARQVAELGYVAFAVDMYGKGQVTTDAKQAGAWAGALRGKPLLRERATAGLNVLLSQPQVDASRVAAIGYCFGGTTVLELAYGGAPVRGVVSFHGSLTTGWDNDLSKLKAAILVCHGAADAFISEQEMTNFVSKLNEAKADYTLISYAGALHSFTNPNAGKAGIPGVAYQEVADRRSWAHMKAFFEELFAK